MAPLLEAWFATLGSRLVNAKAQEEAGGLPEAVQQASTRLWEVAVSQARQEIEMAASVTRQALREERTIFELRVTEQAQHEAVSAERQAAAERALDVAQKQIADLGVRLKDIQAVLVQRDQDIQEVLSKLTAVEQQRDAERLRAEAESHRHIKELNKAEERAAAHERRLLQEIDRERQEAKSARATVAAAERRENDACKQFEQNKQRLGDQLLHADEELRSNRQALVSAHERATELRALLDAQVATSAATLNQLNMLMAGKTLPKSMNTAKRSRISKLAADYGAEKIQR